MIPYHRLLQRAFNTPLFCMPQKARIIGDYLLRRAAGVEVPHPRACDMCDDDFASGENDGGELYPVVDGVAIIRIVGELVNRGGWIGASSGLVSYEGIKRQCAAAESDGRVKAVIVDGDSPGGEAVGMAGAAAAVRRLASVKPVHFFINGLCCSAMYGLAANGTRITATPDSIVGSIGTYLMHVDIAKALEAEGVKITLIHEGEHKVDGNPYEALPDDVRADLQGEVKQFYDLFVATVAEGRKRLTEEAIRATGARTYIGQQAVDVGLVDALGTFEELLVSTASAQPGAPALRNENGPHESVAVNQENASMQKSTVKSILSAVFTPAFAEMIIKAEAEGEEPKPPAEEQPKAACDKCGKDDCPGGDECSGGDAGTDSSAEQVHLAGESDAASRALGVARCGVGAGSRALEASRISANLDEVTCASCVRSEFAAREAKRKKIDADAAQAALAQQIEVDANAFAAKCGNLGQSATAAMRSRYVAARQANDTAAVAELETIVASIHAPGAQARVDGADGGPSAEDIAKRVSQNGEHFVALEIVAKKGVKQNDPRFAKEYEAALVSVQKGGK